MEVQPVGPVHLILKALLASTYIEMNMLRKQP